jgi:uncharacterized membrane protein
MEFWQILAKEEPFERWALIGTVIFVAIAAVTGLITGIGLITGHVSP